MPKKGAKDKSKASKTASNIAGGQKEEIVPPTAQEVLELVTARKKLERALQVPVKSELRFVHSYQRFL